MHREPAVAGLFYRDDPHELKEEVKAYINTSNVQSNEAVKFIISPHAGYIYSGKIAGDAFAEVQTNKPDKVVILGPSHRVYLNGIAESGSENWNTPMGSVKIKGSGIPGIGNNYEAHEHEHCLEVQIPFLQTLFPNADYLPFLVSGNHKSANLIAEKLLSLDSEGTLWVISSDFNHVGPNFQHYPEQYGYKSGKSMDLEAIDYITKGDIEGFSKYLDKVQATVCGSLPILVAMHLVKRMGRREFIFKSYDCSGDQTGDRNSVGYAALFS